MLFDRLKRGYWAFCDATSPGARVLAAFVVVFIVSIGIMAVREYFDEYAFNHLSPAEHFFVFL
ncbi:MAG: hypothetical protein ABSC64_14210 [Candidatus Korobacteraceae bacterium]|jgi:hypothetical protein